MPRGKYKHKPHQGFQKGYKLSKEAKIKIIEAHKGKPGYWLGKKMSDEHKRKIGKAHVGFKYSEESKKKLSEAAKRRGLGKSFKGIRWPEERKKILSESRFGKNNPAWKGGRSRGKHNSRFYKDWTLKIYSRDNFTCQGCGSVGGALNAHHIKPWAKYPELRYELTNGITLCINCHKKIHKLKQ